MKPNFKTGGLSLWIAFLTALSVIAVACAQETPIPTPTPTVAPAPTPTSAPTATSTPAPSPLYPVPKGFDISISVPGAAGAKDVYIITSDDLEQLTNDPGVDNTGASWSPDCSRIVFYSNRDGYPTALFKIYVMNPDGAGVVKLLDSPNTDDKFARWSPDGTRIAFTRTEAYWEPDPERPGSPWRFSHTSDIYLVNADGSGLTRLTSGSGGKVVSDWSPDGRRILFDGGQEDNGEIYVINVDGTGLRNLTNNPVEDYHARWSPDGKRIVFASNREQIEEFGPANRWNWPEAGLDIYVMDADGGNVTRMTDHPENDMLPYWSPDGKWISFTSARISGLGGANEPGRWDVYVMEADGSDVQHVIQGEGHGGWSTCKAQR